MTDEHAREVLQCLLDGFDPVTGEVLPPDHVCSSAEVLRALHRAILRLSSTEASASCDEPPLHAGRPWTETDSAALQHMYQAGCSMEEICAKLHRRKRGVMKQLSTLGLLPPGQNAPSKANAKYARAGLPWTQEEDELLNQLVAQDCTIEEISHKMGRTSFAIFCRLEKRKGDASTSEEEPPAPELPPWGDAETRQLGEMFAAGRSIREMAQYFHRNESSIAARLFYMGLTKSAPVRLTTQSTGK